MARIRGTSGPDAITGTAQADRIYGLGGNDYIVGHDGNDVIAGGDGDDYLTDSDDEYGGNGGGFDKFFGGNGNDTLIGGWGGAELHGGNGDDTLSGSGRLDGDAGNDTIWFWGNDFTQNTVRGGAGNDTIQGGYGRVDGGAGDDILWANGSVHGGAGNDYFNPQGDLMRSAESILPPSFLTGGPGSDMFDIAHYDNSIDIGHVTINDFRPDQGDRFDLLTYKFEDEAGKTYAQQRLDTFYTYDQNWSTGTQQFDGVIRVGDFGTSAAPDGSLQLHPLSGVGYVTLHGVDHINLQDWIIW